MAKQSEKIRADENNSQRYRTRDTIEYISSYKFRVNEFYYVFIFFQYILLVFESCDIRNYYFVDSQISILSWNLCVISTDSVDSFISPLTHDH